VSKLEKIPLITENELFVNPSELCVIDDVSKRIHFVLSDTSYYYKLFGFSDAKETLKLLNELKIYDYIRNLSDDKKKYFVPVIGVYKIENSSIIEKNVNISSQKKSKTLYVTKTGKISESITTIIDRKTGNSSFLTYPILQNIFLAVKEMHEIGIVHLDLHLGNLLVDEDNKVYIFDFDTSYLKGVSDGPFTESSEPNLEVIKKIDILKLLKNLIIYDINRILKFNPSDQTIYANIVSQLEDDSYINSIRDAKEQMSSIFGDKSASDIIDVLLNSIVQTGEKKYKKS
jgi:serine/threonine protein kinase